MGHQGSISGTVYYHGTNCDFIYFNPNRIGSNSEDDEIFKGYYFTDNIDDAKLFGEQIIKATLSLKKTIDLRTHSLFTLESQAADIWEIASGEVLTNAEALNKINEEIDMGELAEFSYLLTTEGANATIVNKGYDNIIQTFDYNKTEIIVFSSNQIQRIFDS